MTLLITVFAAVIATVNWYKRDDDSMKLGILLFLYWGASLMWLVDAIFEYAELKADYFAPAAADMLNDTFLGLAVVALGLVIWLVKVPMPDPLTVWALLIVGSAEVLQQIPRAITGNPPSARTSPPQMAEVVVISDTAPVATSARPSCVVIII